MDCAAVKPRMEALVNGSLPEAERAPAEQHIAICEGCRLELELVRAIGSQEKPPTVGKDDWTLDRIFGAEGKQAKVEHAPSAASSPPPAASPAHSQPATPPPSGELPKFRSSSAPMTADDGSMVEHSGPDPAPESGALSSAKSAAAEEASSSPLDKARSNADEKRVEPKRPSPSWNFEPADANADVNLPEESLFFATEALTRRKEPESSRGSSFRVILWGVGGLVGAILLAFSSWFVLHMSAPGSDGTGSKMEEDFTLEDPEAPNPGTAQPPADGGSQPDPSSDAPDQTAHAQPPTPAPRVSASSVPSIPDGSRGTTMMPTTPVSPGSGKTAAANPGSARATPPPVPRSSTSGTTVPNPAPAGSSPRVATTAPKPSSGSQHATAAGQRRGTPEPVNPSARTVTRRPDDDLDAPETHIPYITPMPPATQGTNDEDLAPPPTPGPAATATTRKPAPPEVATPSEEKPPEPLLDTPIQRLHLATVASEERGDLADLRRLRSAWKEFMTRTVGPDRARARREYANCLWAIQNLTGKRGDQKETLAAYREYLLTAPAGGADSRSASRLRQLEEAVTEKR